MNKSLVCISGLDHVVPVITVESGGVYVDLGEICIRDLFAGLVWGRVQCGFDAQPGVRCRIGHEIDDHLMAH